MSPETKPPAGASPGHRLRIPGFLAWAPGLVLLAGLVWVVTAHVAEERELAALLAGSRPSWLLLAVLLQAATYLSVGETWRVPLTAAARPMPHGMLARLALLKLTFDQAVPTGGFSGTAFMVQALRRHGVASDVLGATMLIVLVGYYFAYAIAVAIALVVLSAYRDLNPLVAAIAASFAVLAATLPLLLVWSVVRMRVGIPLLLRRIPFVRAVIEQTEVVDPDLLRRKVLFLGSMTGSLITMVLDAATLAVCLLALGDVPDPFSCFSALVMASVAATVGIMPGGLGTFEAACVAVLTVTGTDAASALGATLLLRGFTFWLPMVPGALLLRFGLRS